MEKGFFITGTDTGVGKTTVTVALMHYFQAQGKTVMGMKPVASGCTQINGQLRNDDALALQQQASVAIDYSLINPYAFELPVAPHLATTEPIDFSKILTSFQTLSELAQIILVEGVGGWLVPFNFAGDNVATLAKTLELPVIMVVAIRLGCINHALLTYQAIQHSGVNCAGWIAVCLEPQMLLLDENIATLQRLIDAPLLAILPYKEQQLKMLGLKNL